MGSLDTLKTFPIGSILTRPEEEDVHYLQKIRQLPQNLRKLISSPTTSAFIRGLTKTYDVPPDKNPLVAFVVLQIVCGERTLSQLANTLATELRLAHGQSQKMAIEIEKELFAPVMLELNKHLTQQKKQSTVAENPLPSQAGGARNVLDLKSQPRPPLPPPIPRR